MKTEFIEYVKTLMDLNPDVVMPEEAQKYFELISKTEEKVKPALTNNGRMVLQYMQDNSETVTLKARDIAEGLFIQTRTVAGSMRKLITDGFVDTIKEDKTTTLYTLTEKGKNYNLKGEN